MTEKFDLIHFGWLGGRVAGESGIKANLSLSLSWSWVEWRLSLAKIKVQLLFCQKVSLSVVTVTVKVTKKKLRNRIILPIEKYQEILSNIILSSIFSCGATQYTLLCVCLFSVFDMRYLSFFEYQEYSRIFKEREISYQKQITDIQQAQMKEIKIMSYTYKGQLSTNKDDWNLGLISNTPFPVLAGIKIISSQNRIWN